MAPSVSFSKPLVAGHLKASLANLSPQLHLFRNLEGSLAWGPSLLLARQAHREAPLAGVLLCIQCIRHLKGHPGWGPTM